MTTKRQVRVITEGGHLVGISVPSPSGPGTKPGAPVARLRAGPGQEEHELEIEWPTEREATDLAEALHARARKALRLR